MEGTYVDNPFRGSYLDTSENEDLLLEDWLPKKKDKKFQEILKRRKIAILSISIALLITTAVIIAIIVHVYSSPCHNNGVYYKNENGIFMCNCNGTNFTGDQCETPNMPHTSIIKKILEPR